MLEDADARPVVLVKGVAAGSLDPGFDQLNGLPIHQRGAGGAIGQQLLCSRVVVQRIGRHLRPGGRKKGDELGIHRRGATPRPAGLRGP